MQVTLVNVQNKDTRTVAAEPQGDVVALVNETFKDVGDVTVYHKTGAPYQKGDKIVGGELFAAPPDKREKNKEEPVIRLCILGPGAVGKSALTLRYTNNHFQEEYDPTIEDAYRKTVTIDGHVATLDILDTAGQEDFTALRGAWYRNKDGFLLIFSIIDKNTLDDLANFQEQLVDFYEGEVVPPIIIVGNKSDLEASSTSCWNGALQLKAKWNAEEVLKTSAKTGSGVSAAFATIVRAVRRRKVNTPQKKRGRCICL